ncbi:hypothetical protein KP509_31G069700 [Ceratopteris richardii]|uniref:Pentatricopeptide repeat-containing protein n=1 Tax=Ceratopteris richardii TaxID=49495 RepID=A0A8T2QZR3_CERRI|nr:hypothetical protein KP509_31G069700 [Ceratopteris richardii]
MQETQRRFAGNCELVNSLLNTLERKSRSTCAPQAHIQCTALQDNSSIMIEDDATEDDESIIGGNDVSTLVRKVPSEPSLRRAVRMIDIVMDRNIKISINTFSSLIQRCSRERDLIAGKRVHEQLLENNYKANVLLANMLIDMYGKCGSVEDAQRVFDGMSRHNIYSWSTLISAYASKGMVLEAVQVFKDMQKAGSQPDKMVYVVLLQACGTEKNLKQGKWLHHQICRNGLASDLVVGNALIDMYAKCGHLELALDVFHRLPEYNAESWDALIGGYVSEGLEEHAFGLYYKMREQSIEPNEGIFVSILEACAMIMDIYRGRQFHSHIVNSDYESSLPVSNSLLYMYMKNGHLASALIVFNKMYEHDINTWNSLIDGHMHQALHEDALFLYQQLQETGTTSPDEETIKSVIMACTSMRALGTGRNLHNEVMKYGYDLNVNIGNALIDLYSSCGCTYDAKVVFSFLPDCNPTIWNEMIRGYAQDGLAKKALSDV